MTRFCRTLAGAALVPLLATIVSGQTIRGVVVDQGGTPLPGVVMQLVDSASNIAGRALSNERGEYRIVAARAGTYRLRTMRIGYRPTTSCYSRCGRRSNGSEDSMLCAGLSR